MPRPLSARSDQLAVEGGSRAARRNGHILLPMLASHGRKWCCMICQSTAPCSGFAWQRPCPGTPATRAWDVHIDFGACGLRQHRLVELEAPAMLAVACTRCGAFGRRTLRLLTKPCRGRALSNGQLVLDAIHQHWMPGVGVGLCAEPLAMRVGSLAAVQAPFSACA